MCGGLRLLWSSRGMIGGGLSRGVVALVEVDGRL